MTTPSQHLVQAMRTARRWAVWPLLASLLAAAAGLAAGCESGVDQPVEMTPEVRNASEVLPAGVQAVAMVDVAALADDGNPFGGMELDPADATHGEALRARDFFASVGFSPEEDLREVYAAVERLDDRGDAPAVHFAVYADFDRDRIEARLADEADLTTHTYEGTTMYSKTEGDERRTMAFAVANDEMLVAATSVAGVEAMLDRLRGQGTDALGRDEALMPLVREASRHQTMWFAARDLPTDEITEASGRDGEGRSMARVGRAVRDVAGGMSFTSGGGMDGDVTLAVREGTSADDVASLLRGAVRTARTQADEEAVRDALDRVDVAAQDDAVRVGFALSQAAIQSMRGE